MNKCIITTAGNVLLLSATGLIKQILSALCQAAAHRALTSFIDQLMYEKPDKL